MSDHASQVLADLVATHGLDFYLDAPACEAILRDALGPQRREAHLLAAALNAGIPGELRLGVRTTSPEELVDWLARRLRDDRGLDAAASEWAVRAWGTALGVLPSTAAATSTVAQADDEFVVVEVTPRWLPWLVGAGVAAIIVLTVAAVSMIVMAMNTRQPPLVPPTPLQIENPAPHTAPAPANTPGPEVAPEPEPTQEPVTVDVRPQPDAPAVVDPEVEPEPEPTPADDPLPPAPEVAATEPWIVARRLIEEAEIRRNEAALMLEQHRSHRAGVAEALRGDDLALDELYRSYPHEEQTEAFGRMREQAMGAAHEARALDLPSAHRELLAVYLTTQAEAYKKLRESMLREREGGFSRTQPLWREYREGVARRLVNLRARARKAFE